MDYEKKYKEALERARQIHNEDRAQCADVMVKVFPELAESEDERIRKRLIEYFGDEGEWSDGISYKEVRAWLEKQKIKYPVEGDFPYTNPSDNLLGEIDNIWNKLSCNNEFTATKDGFREVILHFVNYLDKQKPSDKVEPITEGLKAEFQKQVSCLISSAKNNEYDYNSDYVKYVSQSLLEYAQHELKSVEWSEKDEGMLNSIIDDVTPLGECPDYPNEEERKYYYEGQNKVNWLKSLKDRCMPQPKQEWSDYDNKCLATIIAGLSTCAGKTLSKDEWSRCNDWLNNLYPQSHWKPTEKQLNSLERVLHYYGDVNPIATEVKYLLEQLKAL